MKKTRVVSLCNCLSIVGILGSFTGFTNNQQSLTSKQMLYNSKVSLSNKQLKRIGDDQNDVLAQFKNYMDQDDHMKKNLDDYENKSKLVLSQRTSHYKRNHGTAKQIGYNDNANKGTSFVFSPCIDDSNNKIYNPLNISKIKIKQSFETNSQYLENWGDIGNNPTGYHKTEDSSWNHNSNIMYEHMENSINYDWSDLLTPSKSSYVTATNNPFSYIISPKFVQPSFNLTTYVSATINTKNQGYYLTPEEVLQQYFNGTQEANNKFPIVLPQSDAQGEKVGTSHKENPGFLYFADWNYTTNGQIDVSHRSNPHDERGVITYYANTTTISCNNLLVTINKKIFQPYFDFYSECFGAAGVVAYHGTDWTTILYSNKENPELKILTANPSDLIQLEKIGYEDDNYYTQTGLNTPLINAALSQYYNDDLMKAYDINGNPTNKTLWVRDFNGYESSNDNALCFAKSRYYKPIAGLSDFESGGRAKWAPYATDTDPGLSPKVTDAYYNEFFGKLSSALDDLSTVTGENPTYQGYLTYDNYFKLRNWVKKYCETYGYLPTGDDWNKHNDGARHDIEPITLPFLKEVLNPQTGECKNNGWAEYLKNKYQSVDEKYKFDLNDCSLLKDLSVIYPSLNFDGWNNVFYGDDVQSVVSSRWSNSAQNILPELDGKDGKGKTFDQIINGEYSKYTIPSSEISSSNPNLDIIFNDASNIHQANSKYLDDFDHSTYYDWTAEKNENYDESEHYRSGNTNIGYLGSRTKGAIKTEDMSFETNSNSKATTKGVVIPKKLSILDRVDDGDYGLDKKVQVMIKPYCLASDFYDTDTPNPNFDAAAYENDNFNPDNQPYALKPAGTIINQIKGNSNDMSDYDVLKEMFIDHKNNNEKALPYALVDLINNDNFTFNLKPTSTQPTDFSADINFTIDDTSGQMIIGDGDGYNYTVSGFEKNSDPYIPSGGVAPSKVGIIVGCSLAGAAVVGIGFTIFFNRRRTTRSLSPEVKTRRKIGDIED